MEMAQTGVVTRAGTRPLEVSVILLRLGFLAGINPWKVPQAGTCTGYLAPCTWVCFWLVLGAVGDWCLNSGTQLSVCASGLGSSGPHSKVVIPTDLSQIV